MFSKVGFWGSIASIVALVYSFSSTAGNTTQNVNGSQNTVVGENHGDININYGSPQNNTSQGQLVLNNRSAGSILIRSETDVATITDQSTHVCLAISGTGVQLTGRKTSQGFMQYKEVKILSGECKGRIGWVAHEMLAYE